MTGKTDIKTLIIEAEFDGEEVHKYDWKDGCKTLISELEF